MPTTNPDPTDLLQSISDTIEEDLGTGIHESLPGLDPVFRELYSTSMGVTREGIGRDLKVIHVMEDGVSGSVKWVAVGGGAPMDLAGAGGALGGPHGSFVPESAITEWPGLSEQATPGFFRKTVTLARCVGNLYIPNEFVRASMLDASIGKVHKIMMRGHAKNNALADIQCFYSRTVRREIASIGAVSYDSNRATSDRAVIIVKGGAVRNFYTGMFVDIFDVTGATRRNNTAGTNDLLMVDGVRYVPSATDAGYGLIYLQNVSTTAGDLSGLSIAATDIIVRKDSIATAVGLGPLGPRSWMATSGTVFGMDLAIYTQLHSIVAAVSGPLTDLVLNQYFGRFRKAYGVQNIPDCGVLSPGALNAYVENSDGLSRFDRTGKPFVIAGGFELGTVPYVYAGQTVKLMASDFMPSDSEMDDATQVGGEAWFFKTREQNFKRYLAPKLPDSKIAGDYGEEVEFLAPGRGEFGIFWPAPSTNGRFTNYWMAPYERHVALLPEMLQGIVLTAVHESL